MTSKAPPKGKAAAKKKAVKKKRAEPAINLPTGEGGDMIPLDLLLRFNTFVDSYMKSLDAVQAATDAGFEGNRARLNAYASHLLRNPYVRTRIEKQYRSILAKTDASVERVWEEISYVAFLDPAVFYDERGDVKPMSEIPEIARRALSGMKVKEGTIGEGGEFVERELRYMGKDAALDKLMRLHRMTDNDKMVLIGGEEFLAAMEEGRARAGKRQ